MPHAQKNGVSPVPYLPSSCFGQLFYTSERGGWGVRTWVVGPGEQCSYTAMGLSWQANAEAASGLSLRVYLAILTQARQNSARLFWTFFSKTFKTTQGSDVNDLE